MRYVAFAIFFTAMAMFVGSLTLTPPASAQSALSSSAIALDKTVSDEGLLQKVHGGHRHCVVGPWSGVIHRHAGPYYKWVRCRAYYNYGYQRKQYRPYGRYCNVHACRYRYRSFRAWDCSYQPYYGPRRRCTL